MSRTPLALADGQQALIYSTSNTYLGKIYVNVSGQLVLEGGNGNDVIVGAVGGAANLIFEESASISGQGTNTIAVGVSGDTFNLNVAGVIYNVDLSGTNCTFSVNTIKMSNTSRVNKFEIAYNATDNSIDFNYVG